MHCFWQGAGSTAETQVVHPHTHCARLYAPPVLPALATTIDLTLGGGSRGVRRERTACVLPLQPRHRAQVGLQISRAGTRDLPL